MKQRISRTNVQADYDALIDAGDHALTLFAIEFPLAYTQMMHVLERPTQRTVAISRDGVTTIFDAAWLDIMRTQDDGSMYGNNTQG